jgi:hypothetical protein
MRRIVRREAVLAGLCILAIVSWLSVPPFSESAQVGLYRDNVLSPDGPTAYYNSWFFTLGMFVWSAGIIQLVWMFFGDLLRAARDAESSGVAKVVVLGTVRSERSKVDAKARALDLLLVPIDTFVRFIAFGLFYALGVRALDVDGMLRQGATLVRTDALSAFSRGAQFLLVGFFNTASLVGEFSTFEVRNWLDIAFTLINFVARFFAIFLVINVAFLRLSAMLIKTAGASEDNSEQKVG